MVDGQAGGFEPSARFAIRKAVGVKVWRPAPKVLDVTELALDGNVFAVAEKRIIDAPEMCQARSPTIPTL